MSLIIKAGTGLVAGAVAGVLGLAFLPRVEAPVEPPRAAVGKPQFVETSPSPKATVQATARAAPAVAVAETVSPAKPAPSPVAQAAPSPNPAPNPSPANSTPPPAAQAVAGPKAVAAIAVATLDPPKPAQTALTRSLSFAEEAAPANKPAVASIKAAAPPAPPALKASNESASVPAANPAAADMSVQGLVALAKGDLSTARLYLTRAAEAGEPRAWVALADSYDPAMLAKLGVVGAPGDAQRAKDYLEKAAAAGVLAAKDRMAALDQAALH